MWRYQVFARKVTWYFIGVYIMNRYPCKNTNFKSEDLAFVLYKKAGRYTATARAPILKRIINERTKLILGINVDLIKQVSQNIHASN